MPDERLQGRDSLPNPEKDKSNTEELEKDNKEQEQAQEKARSILEIIKLMIAMVFPQLAMQITVFQKLAEYINNYAQELSKEAAEREEKESIEGNKERPKEDKELSGQEQKETDAKETGMDGSLKEAGTLVKDNQDSMAKTPVIKEAVKDAPHTMVLKNDEQSRKVSKVSLAQKQQPSMKKSGLDNTPGKDDGNEKNPIKNLAKGFAKNTAKSATNKMVNEAEDKTLGGTKKAMDGQEI